MSIGVAGDSHNSLSKTPEEGCSRTAFIRSLLTVKVSRGSAPIAVFVATIRMPCGLKRFLRTPKAISQERSFKLRMEPSGVAPTEVCLLAIRTDTGDKPRNYVGKSFTRSLQIPKADW